MPVPSLALVLLAVALPAEAQPRPCAGVTCGGHGECFEEADDAYCLCDEGFEAEGRLCMRATSQPPRFRAPTMGTRAVAVAQGELGHRLVEIGAQRASYPGALSRHVPPSALWCSDFVSWVYRAAGVPFTGGYEGGWLLPTNASIRRWFVQRRAWIDRGSPAWSSFVPRPGDYVRIHTRTWGHSAIVSHVEGTTLHAIEGNAGGRVERVRYRHFRVHERVDGFGVLTAVEARLPRATTPAGD